ncbi:glycosyltransferase family 4 protein [Humibacillus xanthopallidus]|uniref:Glycosyl transferase family 4 n=1 Tax=Humibacillus xanthopallidus TaxID=412689 RepID=A0A543I086_9MICO|nr:glycosyltransferase family 1 protein [Humibacillus xanthopallidus]TQM64002.1 glycosyl transferase family 4 [Humibacillus xanthopallidus]
MSARLAVNGRFLSQATTGTQRYALELVTRLVERHPGTVVLHVPRGTEVPAGVAGAAEVRESRARGQVFEQVALPWATRRDLLLSLGGPAPVAARRQVATIHDVSVFRHPQTYSRAFRTWYRAMYRVLSRRAVRVLTVSQFSADELERVLHAPPSRVSIVPNGADHVDRVVATQPDLTAYPGLAAGEPWVLCVGTFARHKNLGPALDALESAGIASVVVGARGSAAVFAEAGAQRWSRAHFAGRLSDEELTWLYGHATALVFPSLYEGFGIPVVEAQRLGCPVVALDTGPMREVGGDAVMLCDPGHPEQVVEAVRRLVEEPDLRAATVEAGRRNAERFRWDASADRLEDALTRAGWSW